jgi:hypothetical protein
MPWSKAERHAIYDCLRKKIRDQAGAERLAGNGLHAYPCPYSQIAYHWHLTSEIPSAKPEFYAVRDRRARAEGGLGFPDGWVVATIRQARADAKARRG